jgi:[acyl-carrier-protein] S-malonyltransferase
LTFAMVFPGQGSQAPGMQSALAEKSADVRQTYTEASEVLGFDLWQLVQQGPEERLNDTRVTQPAMLTAGFAAWRVWCSSGGSKPAYMAGHSLGEYTALVCAGSLSFATALQLVRRRAELMQAAVPTGQGAMAAILGLDDEAVVAVCRRAAQDEVVEAVNFNSPGQVVIAGHRTAVERAAEQAKAAGAKRAVLLNVSVPSHCALMKPAAAELAKTLTETAFAAPAIPVISNVDVATYVTAEQIREGLERQLYNPVRWTETIRQLVANGATAIIECGPGKVLAGLTKRIERAVDTVSFDTPEAIEGSIR